MKWNPLALPVWKADSDFGGETETWTKKFQEAIGIPQTGIVDAITYGHMANVLMSLTTGITQAMLESESLRANLAELDASNLRGDLDRMTEHLRQVGAARDEANAKLDKIREARDLVHSL
jgi:hypothetical protein